LLLSGVLDVLIEIGQHGFGTSLRRQRRRAHPALPGLSAFLLGGLAGGVATWVWPMRLFGAGPLPGMSMIVTPVVDGLLMHAYGSWREQRGIERFFLASFWGGALFAFGVSLVRFLLVVVEA
jgi:hypothetical protein